MKLRGGDLREFEHFSGTRLLVLEGTGVEADPFREVTYWFDETAKLIARDDPAAGAKDADPSECAHGVLLTMACSECWDDSPAGASRRQMCA